MLLKYITYIVFVILQARYDASELITQREIVSRTVSDELTERCSQFGIILDDISIVSSCVYR